MHKKCLPLFLAFIFLHLGCAHKEGPLSSSESMRSQASTPDYRERRSAYQTEMNHHGPIVAKGLPTQNDKTPEGFEKVLFKSGDLELWGWLSKDEGDAQKPVLVYFHGHYALRAKHMPPLQPFVDAGFRVFAPTLRGRNENAGSHELLFGEVDDARAAVNFVAAQEGTDKERIYTIGHSLGGGLSALLSFYEDLPVRITASVGAIYSTETFASWAKNDPERLIRFDVKDKNETELRVLLPHAQDIVKRHVAYMGESEKTTQENAAAVLKKSPQLFSRVVVPGNHSSALKPALERYLELLMQDL